VKKGRSRHREKALRATTIGRGVYNYTAKPNPAGGHSCLFCTGAVEGKKEGYHVVGGRGGKTGKVGVAAKSNALPGSVPFFIWGDSRGKKRKGKWKPAGKGGNNTMVAVRENKTKSICT